MSEPPDPPEPKAPTLGDPQTATAAELFEAAAHHEGRARFHEAMARSSLSLAETYRQRAESRLAVEIGTSRLTSQDSLNTLDDVNASPTANSMRAKKQLDANPDHKFVALLKRRELTVPEVAAALSVRLRRAVPRNTVQSWYKKTNDTGFRRIPEDAAAALEALYGLPVDSWPRRAPAKK